MSRDQQEILIELLVIQTQAGDSQSMGQLAELLQHELVAYSFRLIGDPHAARDVAQETWLSVLRGIGRLRDPSSFRAWLFRIVHHKSMDRLRSVVRERTEQDHLRATAAEQTKLSSQHQDHDITIVQNLIQTLPSNDRAVLALFYEHELSIREIANITGNSESATKSKLYHLRQNLKTRLNQLERNPHDS